MQCFIAQSHIHPCFTGMMLTLSHFPHEPECEDYAFLDQAIEDFEHGLDSILMDSVDTPEPDASFDGADAMPSPVSSGFLYSINTVFDNSRPQLASSIKSYKFCLQTRDLSLTQAGKMSASKLIYNFPAIHQHLDSGFLCQLLTSLWLLPIRRLVSLLIFRVALVQLPMPL